MMDSTPYYGFEIQIGGIRGTGAEPQRALLGPSVVLTV